MYYFVSKSAAYGTQDLTRAKPCVRNIFSGLIVFSMMLVSFLTIFIKPVLYSAIPVPLVAKIVFSQSPGFYR